MTLFHSFFFLWLIFSVCVCVSVSLCLWVCITTFLSHLSVNRYLGCFHVLAIVNSGRFLFFPKVKGSKSGPSFSERVDFFSVVIYKFPFTNWTLSSLYSFFGSVQFSSVQPHSHVWLFATPWVAARQASLSITNSRSSLKLTCIELVMPFSHLILCCPLPPAPNPSQHQSLFQWVNSLHEVAKVLEFQLYHHSLQRTPRADLL